MATELHGARVRLRPLRVDEERQLREWRALGGFASADSPGHRERFRRRIERSGELADGRLWLGIEVDGELVGDLEARQPIDALPPGVFELGIAVAPDHQGRGLGTEAVEALVTHLFAALGAERVQASTATWNAPMRTVLEKLGFAEEGVLRAFMPAGDGRDDYVMYAVTRASWRSGA